MKWHGVIGYAETVETEPGIWVEQITERTHYGDVIRNSRMLQSIDKINNDINISNSISIVANPYASQNFHTMRYIEFMGVKWMISTVEVQYPRLILTLGGVYNGN